MAESEILNETTELLKNRGQSLREISIRSGINYHWLCKFQQGLIDDPGVRKIEQLRNFLTSTAAA